MAEDWLVRSTAVLVVRDGPVAENRVTTYGATTATLFKRQNRRRHVRRSVLSILTNAESQ